MARMPGADWQGESGSRSMSRYDSVCIHTIVGYAPAHAAHFSTDGGGKIYQSRDTRYRSAANLNGNHRIISIENADHGSGFPKWNTRGTDVPPFTSKQCEAIAQILAWAHKTHGIPLVLMKDSRPGSRGISFHRLGCNPYRVGGGELWSNAYGKVCPGDKRIAQIPQIIKRAQQIAGGEDDDMPYTPDQLKAIFIQALGEALKPGTGDTDVRNGIAMLLQDVILPDPDNKKTVATSLLDYTNPDVGGGDKTVYRMLRDIDAGVEQLVESDD